MEDEMKKGKQSLLFRLSAPLGVLLLVLFWLAMITAPDDFLVVDTGSYPAAQRPLPTNHLGQNFVSNGGFENDSTGWTLVQDVSISTSTVHSGSKALMTTDPDSSRFSYVFQELNFDYDSTEVSLWIFPESAAYVSTFELIANWQGGTGTFITRVVMRDDIIAFTAVDTSASIVNVLTPNSWNNITIEINAANLTQSFYINDVHYSSLTSSSLPTLEHLLVGDLSGSTHFGTVFYDDISITGTVTSPNPIAVDDQYVDSGPEAKFFPILRNDVIPVGVNVEILVESPPQHGQILSIEPDGIWYQKDQGYEGSDEFSYVLNVPGQPKSESKIDPALLLVRAALCACGFSDLCQTSPDPVRNLVQPWLTRDLPEALDTLDIDLVYRWRDEVLLTTEAGASFFNTVVFNSPEILQLVLYDQPEMREQILTVFAMLQPPARSLLEEDGSVVITSAQVDSVETFFAKLSAGVSDELQVILEERLAALGPFDQYVGLAVKDAFTLYSSSTGTAIEEESPTTSTGFVLDQNYPNPFASATQIRYSLPSTSSVSLIVYDIQGRKVRTLIDSKQEKGIQHVAWNGLDDVGLEVSSGVYFLRLSTPTFQESKKIIVSR